MSKSSEVRAQKAPENVVVVEQNGTLYLAIKLDEVHGLSESGKSVFVATSHGFMPVEGHEGMIFSLNVLRVIPKAERKNPDGWLAALTPKPEPASQPKTTEVNGEAQQHLPPALAPVAPQAQPAA